MQLVDELSMIYTTCIMVYATFSYGRSRRFSITLAIGLLSLAIFITGYYHYLQDPLFHQNAYAALTATVLLRSMYVMEVNLRPSRRGIQDQKVTSSQAGPRGSQQLSEQRGMDKRNLDILRRMWMLIAYGLSIFLGGFAIWGLDNKYCTTLRQWRRQIGLPWGILLEGHGWW
jgi:dihydroceramidase